MTTIPPSDQWKTPPAKFQSIYFERINPKRNEKRYYYIGWQPTLTDDGAVVCIYGRKGVGQRVLSPPPFNSLAEAWPTIIPRLIIFAGRLPADLAVVGS